MKMSGCSFGWGGIDVGLDADIRTRRSWCIREYSQLLHRAEPSLELVLLPPRAHQVAVVIPAIIPVDATDAGAAVEHGAEVARAAEVLHSAVVAHAGHVGVVAIIAVIRSTALARVRARLKRKMVVRLGDVFPGLRLGLHVREERGGAAEVVEPGRGAIDVADGQLQVDVVVGGRGRVG